MKPFLGGSAAILILAATGGSVFAQEVFRSLLEALPAVEAEDYEVTREGDDEVVTDVTLVSADASETDVGRITIDRIVFSDVGPQADGAAMPEIDGVAVEGFTREYGDPDRRRVAVERMEATDADFPGLLAIALGTAEPDPAVLGNLGSLTLEGVSTEAEGRVASIARMSVEDVESGVIGSFQLEGMRAEQSAPRYPVRWVLESVEAYDIGLGLLADLAGGEEDDVSQAFSEVRLGSVLIRNLVVEYTPGGSPEEVHDISLSSLTIDGLRFEADIPTAMEVRLSDLSAPVGALQDETAIRVLRDAGWERASMDFRLSYHVDTARGTLVVDDLRFAIADFAGFDAALALSGLPTDVLADPAAFAEERLETVALDRLRLRIEDEGMIEISLAVAGEQTGQSREALIQQAVGTATIGIGTLGVPALRDAPRAIERFIRESGALVLRLSPEDPVPIMTAVSVGEEDPAAAVEMFAPSLVHQ